MNWNYKQGSDIPYEISCRISDQIKVPLLQFDILNRTGLVKHCFTTRQGGVSEGIYESMNLGYTRGDDEKAVTENYDRLSEAMGIRKENIVLAKQTHTANVRKVTRSDCGKGVVRERDYDDVDALITNEPEIVLGIFMADCVPVCLVDRKKKAIGLAHSGWRGTVQRITQNTLYAMKKEYGTDPADVAAAIGPSICQDCYEVSKDVADEFYAEFSEDHWKELLYAKENGKYQLNLWKANEIVLTEAGVPKDQIETTALCTCCNPKRLFSHRASHGKRGTLAAFLMLEP